MELIEAKSGAKALYLQAAAMAGFEVSPDSPDRLAEIVDEGFPLVDPGRRPEAIANLLRVIAATLEHGHNTGTTMLRETNVKGGQNKVCPVYPFGAQPVAKKAATKTAKKALKRGRA